MKTLWLAALALAGCNGVVPRVAPGPAPAPQFLELRSVLHLNGSGDGQTFVIVTVDPVTGKPVLTPFSSLVKWSGNGTATTVANATGVTLYLEGDSTFTVTPIPGLEGEAEKAVSMGRIVIRRNGQPALLSPTPAQMPMPVPTPPPPPIPETKPPCPPVAECVGGSCSIPSGS